MKKTILSLFVLLFIITLAACSNQEETSEETQPNTNIEESQSGSNNESTEEANNDKATEEETHNTDESEMDETANELEEVILPTVSLAFLNLTTNDYAFEANREVQLQYENIVALGGQVEYNIMVNYEGTILFDNEYTLVILPGEGLPPYSNVASITVSNGIITITGLQFGEGFYRIQVYVGSDLVLTTSNIEILVD